MAIMPDALRLTPAEEADLADIRAKARARHEKDRKAARRRGRVDFPDLPYECSWAYEEAYLRANRGQPPRKRRPVTKRQIQVGMTVTCIERTEAYYSGRNGNPTVFFEPGVHGTVAAVDVPCTTYAYRSRGGTSTFVCVDFDGPPWNENPRYANTSGRTWRVGLYYNNIKVIK